MRTPPPIKCISNHWIKAKHLQSLRWKVATRIWQASVGENPQPQQHFESSGSRQSTYTLQGENVPLARWDPTTTNFILTHLGRGKALTPFKVKTFREDLTGNWRDKTQPQQTLFWIIGSRQGTYTLQGERWPPGFDRHQLVSTISHNSISNHRVEAKHLHPSRWKVATRIWQASVGEHHQPQQHFESSGWGKALTPFKVKTFHEDLTGISEVSPNHNKLHFESSGRGKALTPFKVKTFREDLTGNWRDRTQPQQPLFRIIGSRQGTYTLQGERWPPVFDRHQLVSTISHNSISNHWVEAKHLHTGRRKRSMRIWQASARWDPTTTNFISNHRV